MCSWKGLYGPVGPQTPFVDEGTEIWSDFIVGKKMPGFCPHEWDQWPESSPALPHVRTQ